MLPYEDVIDYSSFSVFFSEQELLDDPNTNIMDILDAMPSSEIKRLQENVRRVKKHFIYHDGAPEPGDAFDMFVSISPLTSTRRSADGLTRSANLLKSTSIVDA